MGDRLEIKSSDTADPKSFYGLLRGNIAQYLRDGTLFYWSSFFILILVEFYIGGRLSIVLNNENYSVYIRVLNTLPFYNILTNIGISYSIVYIVSYNRQLGPGLFRQATRLQFLWYLAIVAIHAAAFLVFRNTYLQTLLITSIISYTYAYRVNITSYFLATKSFNKAAIANLLQKISLLAVFVTIYAVDGIHQPFNAHFPFLYTGIELVVVLLFFVAFPVTTWRTIKAEKANYRKRLLRYGKYATINNGLNVLYYTIIVVIIRASGLEIHQQIILGLCIIFFRYTAVAIAPIFSTMNPQLTLVKNDNSKIQDLYKKYLLITAVLSVCTLLACRFLFVFFIDRFYDAAYHDLPRYFNFFSYLVPLLFLTSLNGSVLASLGRIKFTTGVEIACTTLLMAFFAYNYFVPIVDYIVISYFVMVHLVLKFILLNIGVYKTIRLS